MNGETVDEAPKQEGGSEVAPARSHPALLADKLYFKIGEVAKIVGVKPYVLRYWESEFSVVKPGKTRSKHRLYRRRDVETLLRIKDLLHGRRFTIEGARRQLRQEAAAEGADSVAPAAAAESLREVRDALVAIRDALT